MKARQFIETGVTIGAAALLVTAVGSLYSVPTLVITAVIATLLGCGVVWGDGSVTCRKIIAVGIVLAGAAVAFGWFTHPVLTVLVGSALALVVGVGTVWRHRNAHSATLINRWKARSQKHQGVASFWTILRVSSRWAMRRKATILRPHLAGVSRWARLWTPTTEYAAPIMRAGWLWVYTPIEDVTVALGGPRTGKSGQLAWHILDAPGAVIVTSTRTDLFDNTWRQRVRKGPVRVFNPSGVGGLQSTITFSPLSGCADPEVATARAADLLSPGGRVSGPNGDSFWADMARLSLATLLHAAALREEGTMWDVRSWVAHPGRAAERVMGLLQDSPSMSFRLNAHQFFMGGDSRRDSVCAIIMPALSWLNDPKADVATRDGDLNVEELLRSKGTLYLLGAEDATAAPLVTALTGHIAREARRIAGLQPRGRLNPPLTLALDEAALICPVPLDKWTADMGGRNITIHIRAQSKAQLRQRWGPDGASAILTNAATLLLFGGARDAADLAEYSALVQELTPNLIAHLPRGHVVMIRRDMLPVVGRLPMVWKRHRVRRRVAAPFVALASAWAARRARLTPVPVPPVRRPIAALPAGRPAADDRQSAMATTTDGTGRV